MLSRAWKPLAGATVLIGGPTYAYYTWDRKPAVQTFDLGVRVRGPDGRPAMTTRTFSLLSKAEVDTRIREHARTETKRLAGGQWSWTTAAVASNAPIEDANANAILSRDDTVKGPAGDLLFWAVMDGHGGYHTSRLLSKVLIPAVAVELQTLNEDPETIAPKTNILQDVMKSVFGRQQGTPAKPIRFDADPTYVSLALQTAFANLDSELINAPIRLMAANIDQKARDSKILPDLSQHPMALATMLPAMSGSCAIMAFVDTAHQHLYVANTGDARAVAGYWDEASDGTGAWRMEVLTEDQTGRNPKELARVQSEHPAEEAPYVIQRGRILGGLEPSRAFGDARYKWPREIQQMLAQTLVRDKDMRAAPSLLKTPPYVTARPVVTHRPLDPTAAASASSSSLSKPVVRSTPRFLVLATDGLWDKLSSEDVVTLVAGHISGVRGSVSGPSLRSKVPISTGAAGVEGKDKGLVRADASKAQWAFEDDNLSAHLIRNAFGGADEMALRRLMSIPSSHSRAYRDDVTVTVVVFPQPGEGEAAVKAKL